MNSTAKLVRERVKGCLRDETDFFEIVTASVEQSIIIIAVIVITNIPLSLSVVSDAMSHLSCDNKWLTYHLTAIIK